MRPFWLIPAASYMVHPEGTKLLRSRVPFVASQIQPPASLSPTTTPELLRQPAPTADPAWPAPAGAGIAATPEPCR
jgi:hypothetical protein